MLIFLLLHFRFLSYVVLNKSRRIVLFFGKYAVDLPRKFTAVLDLCDSFTDLDCFWAAKCSAPNKSSINWKLHLKQSSYSLKEISPKLHVVNVTFKNWNENRTGLYFGTSVHRNKVWTKLLRNENLKKKYIYTITLASWWLIMFRQRNTSLVKSIPCALSSARAKNTSPTEVRRE